MTLGGGYMLPSREGHAIDLLWKLSFVDEQEVVAEGVCLDECDRHLLAAEGEQVPAKPLDQRLRQSVEGPHEGLVVHGALPAAVEA